MPMGNAYVAMPQLRLHARLMDGREWHAGQNASHFMTVGRRRHMLSTERARLDIPHEGTLALFACCITQRAVAPPCRVHGATNWPVACRVRRRRRTPTSLRLRVLLRCSSCATGTLGARGLRSFFWAACAALVNAAVDDARPRSCHFTTHYMAWLQAYDVGAWYRAAHTHGYLYLLQVGRNPFCTFLFQAGKHSRGNRG